MSSDECCAVVAGDSLGMIDADAVASAFSVDHLDVRFSDSDANETLVGDQLTFDSLVLPYRFSLAAAYDTGQHAFATGPIIITSPMTKIFTYLLNYPLGIGECTARAKYYDSLFLPRELC